MWLGIALYGTSMFFLGVYAGMRESKEQRMWRQWNAQRRAMQIGRDPHG